MNLLQRSTIEGECLKLCTAFAYHLDHGEFESLIGLFIPDGVFVRNGEALNGHQAIREAYAQRPAVTIMHLMSNFHVLEVEEKRVRSSICALIIFGKGVSAQPVTFNPMATMRTIEFADEFRLTATGWRFSSRDARPVLQSLDWPGAG